MIKFLRLKRQRLLAENRFSEYFVFVIAEFVLLVFGILLALQIDNWNGQRADNKREKEYLANLLEDLRHDTIIFEHRWMARYPKKMMGLEMAKNYAMGTLIPADTLAFLRTVSYGGVGSRGRLIGSNTTYLDLISTGNLRIISNEPIRREIISYYGQMTLIPHYIDNLRTEYATYVNSLIPYDPAKPDSVPAIEISRALVKMKSETFHSLANQEITFANSVTPRLKLVDQQATNLIERIEKYLSNE